MPSFSRRFLAAQLPRRVGAGCKLLTNDKFLQMSISQETSLVGRQVSPVGRNDPIGVGKGVGESGAKRPIHLP